MTSIHTIHRRIHTVILTTLTAFLFALPSKAQDHFVLNLLVENCKDISDRLMARTAADAAVVGSTTLLENETAEYEDVLNHLDKRLDNVLTDVNFAADVAILTDKTVRTADLMIKAFDKGLDTAAEYPELLDVVIGAEKVTEGVIVDIYKIIAKVTSLGLKVNLATPEQRKTFLNMIDERVTYLADTMRELMRICYMRSSLGPSGGMDTYLKELLEGKGEELILNRAKRRIDNLEL